MTAIPEPAARLPDEAAFLRAVLADLRADRPRLVYADWLDDCGDPRGDFLRAFTRAARTGADLPDPPSGVSPGWLALTGCDVLAKLRAHDLADLSDMLLRLARPTVNIVPARADQFAPGVSRFGDNPDLPADCEWPADRRGPLPFLAQLNLAELAGSPAAAELPAAGLLSVFYDGDAWGEDDQGWRVLFAPGGVPVARRPGPETFDREYYSGTHPCRLTFVEGLSLPAWDSDELEAVEFGTDARRDAYFEHVVGDLKHHLLGHPRPVQSDMVGPGFRHLLTLDSDDTPGWMWGDMGSLYFLLPTESLAAGRLADGVWFEMQCC